MANIGSLGSSENGFQFSAILEICFTRGTSHYTSSKKNLHNLNQPEHNRKQCIKGKLAFLYSIIVNFLAAARPLEIRIIFRFRQA